jgi:hypothetical protein
MLLRMVLPTIKRTKTTVTIIADEVTYVEACHAILLAAFLYRPLELREEKSLLVYAQGCSGFTVKPYRAVPGWAANQERCS